MEKTITQLKQGFVDSTGKTSEYKAFCRAFKSEFGKVLKGLGCRDLECHYGHFYISGFFSAANGQLWYFSTCDVRHRRDYNILVRTAQHRKDFTGGGNRWADLKNLSSELKRIIG